MRIPVIQGVIARRILLNFRLDPLAVGPLLPPPFRPRLVGGCAVGGICLIRLEAVRPRVLPLAVGLSSENAAHRIAVEWDGDGGRREGVFIPRRDTSSRLNSLVGGRLFPGVHNHAAFDVRETAHSFRVEMESDDGATRIIVDARVASAVPRKSVFGSLQDASEFFRAGAVGYSPDPRRGLDGLELRTSSWNLEPLDVTRVESSFFDDEIRFPPGAARLDSAFLMRAIPHEWHAVPERPEMLAACAGIGPGD